MKLKLSHKKWICFFLVCALILTVIMSCFMYIVDPFFQFRVRDNSYMLNPRFVNAGLIKNYEYDTLIIGSSMAQNFDMELFRQQLDAKPLHVSLGGITPLETVELMALANQQGKAEHYYICVDLHSFSLETKPSTNPSYLMSSGPLYTARYLLSYEAWFRFMPLDLAFSALNKLNINLPPKFTQSTSIDYLGNWENDFTYGEDVVLSNYSSGSYAVSEVDLSGMSERMESNFDMLLSTAASVDGEISFFFPPYSSLYWYSSPDYIDTYLEFKERFISQACKLGFTVYDFQSSSLCADLNNYKDSTHYSGEINDWMTCCFASGEHIVSPETAADFQQSLRDNIALFYKRYSDRLE